MRTFSSSFKPRSFIALCLAAIFFFDVSFQWVIEAKSSFLDPSFPTRQHLSGPPFPAKAEQMLSNTTGLRQAKMATWKLGFALVILDWGIQNKFIVGLAIALFYGYEAVFHYRGHDRFFTLINGILSPIGYLVLFFSFSSIGPWGEWPAQGIGVFYVAYMHALWSENIGSNTAVFKEFETWFQKTKNPIYRWALIEALFELMHTFVDNEYKQDPRKSLVMFLKIGAWYLRDPDARRYYLSKVVSFFSEKHTDLWDQCREDAVFLGWIASLEYGKDIEVELKKPVTGRALRPLLVSPGWGGNEQRDSSLYEQALPEIYRLFQKWEKGASKFWPFTIGDAIPKNLTQRFKRRLEELQQELSKESRNAAHERGKVEAKLMGELNAARAHLSEGRFEMLEAFAFSQKVPAAAEALTQANAELSSLKEQGRRIKNETAQLKARVEEGELSLTQYRFRELAAAIVPNPNPMDTKACRELKRLQDRFQKLIRQAKSMDEIWSAYQGGQWEDLVLHPSDPALKRWVDVLKRRINILKAMQDPAMQFTPDAIRKSVAGVPQLPEELTDVQWLPVLDKLNQMPEGGQVAQAHYDALVRSIQAGQWEEAVRVAETLKMAAPSFPKTTELYAAFISALERIQTRQARRVDEGVEAVSFEDMDDFVPKLLDLLFRRSDGTIHLPDSALNDLLTAARVEKFGYLFSRMVNESARPLTNGSQGTLWLYQTAQKILGALIKWYGTKKIVHPAIEAFLGVAGSVSFENVAFSVQPDQTASANIIRVATGHGIAVAISETAAETSQLTDQVRSRTAVPVFDLSVDPTLKDVIAMGNALAAHARGENGVVFTATPKSLMLHSFYGVLVAYLGFNSGLTSHHKDMGRIYSDLINRLSKDVSMPERSYQTFLDVKEKSGKGAPVLFIDDAIDWLEHLHLIFRLSPVAVVGFSDLPNTALSSNTPFRTYAQQWGRGFFPRLFSPRSFSSGREAVGALSGEDPLPNIMSSLTSHSVMPKARTRNRRIVQTLQQIHVHRNGGQPASDIMVRGDAEEIAAIQDALEVALFLQEQRHREDTSPDDIVLTKWLEVKNQIQKYWEISNPLQSWIDSMDSFVVGDTSVNPSGHLYKALFEMDLPTNDTVFQDIRCRIYGEAIQDPFADVIISVLPTRTEAATDASNARNAWHFIGDIRAADPIPYYPPIGSLGRGGLEAA